MKFVIDNLEVKINDKLILNDFNLTINKGEIHVIMGPNGTGKSTLSNVIMGDDNYQVVSGDIIVDNKSILSLETYERARLGIFLVYQNPISIEGVSNSEFIRTALNEQNEKKVGLYEFIQKMEKSLGFINFVQWFGMLTLSWKNF